MVLVYEAGADSDNEATSVCSVDVEELMKGFTDRFDKSPQNAKQQQPTITTTGTAPHKKSDQGGYRDDELQGLPVDSWHIDLGPLKSADSGGGGTKKGSIPGRQVSKATASTLDIDDDDDDDDDALSFISQEMEEAKLALQDMAVRSFEQSQATLMNDASANSFHPVSPVRKDRTAISLSPMRGRLASPLQRGRSPMRSGLSTMRGRSRQRGGPQPEAEARLEERRAARALRMEKVRLRIAREKEEARQKDEAQRLAALHDQSEDARRKRAYVCYCECGKLSRKELKKRVKQAGAGVMNITEDDVDLLPWSFNGSSVNTGKLAKLGIKI